MAEKYLSIKASLPHGHWLGSKFTTYDGVKWVVISVNGENVTARRAGWLLRLWWWARDEWFGFAGFWGRVWSR